MIIKIPKKQKKSYKNLLQKNNFYVNKLKEYNFKFLFFFVLFSFFCNFAFSAEIINLKRKNKTEKIDITSDILNGVKLKLFSDVIESEGNEKGNSKGNVFVATESGILNTESVFVDKIKNEISINNDLKFRTNENIIGYAKQMIYNTNNKTAKINDVHLFFADDSSLFASKFTKKNEYQYEIENATFSACEINNINEVKFERLRNCNDYSNNQSILNPLNLKTATNTTNELIEKQYSNMPWSLKAEKITINRETEIMEAKNAKIRIAGLTIAKFSNFSKKIDGKPKSGFLFPHLIFLGSRQIGISLPYYIRPASNYDFKITPYIYKDLSFIKGGNSNNTNEQTMDMRRMRANNVEFEYRHLFYDESKKRDSGEINIISSITEKTPLINELTRQYVKSEDGTIIKGNRWHFYGKAKFGITKDIYIRGRLQKESDPNYLAIYYLKYYTYARNYIGLYKANEDGFHGIEVMRFDPLLVQFSRLTTPILKPYIRSIFEKKVDNLIGGRFLLSNSYADLQRYDGFNNKIYNGEVGYTIPIKTESSHYFNFFASQRYDRYRTTYSGYSDSNSGYVNSFLNQTNNSTNIIYDQESRLRYYGMNFENSSYYNKYSRSVYNLSFDYSVPVLTGMGKYAQFIFEPRVKYQQTPDKNDENLVIEDSLSNQLQYSNLFANSRSSGYGIIDSGKKLFYGTDIYGKFPWKNVSSMFTLGVFNYLGSKNNMYRDYYGMNRALSDYVGIFKLYNNHFSFSHEYRVDSSRNVSLLSGFSNPNIHTTTFEINNIYGFTASLSYNKITSIPYGQYGSIKTMSPGISYFFNNGLSIGFSGINLQTDGNEQYNKGRWITKRFFIAKQTNCMFYSLILTQNNFGIPGTAQGVIYRINIGFTGI